MRLFASSFLCPASSLLPPTHQVASASTHNPGLRCITALPASSNLTALEPSPFLFPTPALQGMLGPNHFLALGPCPPPSALPCPADTPPRSINAAHYPHLLQLYHAAGVELEQFSWDFSFSQLGSPRALLCAATLAGRAIPHRGGSWLAVGRVCRDALR